MELTREELVKIVQMAVNTAVRRLECLGYLGKGANESANGNGNSANSKPEKSAYQKTEQLLFNYNNFKKLIREKQQEIEDIRTYGVPEKGSAVVQYRGDCGGTPRGLVLDEERIESAVEAIEKSVESAVEAVELIDKAMATLRFDPYYDVLKMRYFENRTQEDIAVEFNCTQPNIAYHKGRLVKELSVKLFPDKVVDECLN